MAERVQRSIIENKIIAICRGIYGEDLLNLAKALYRGGIRLMEVTFDQNDPEHIQKTTEAIRLLKLNCAGMEVGAGTVINEKQLRATAEAGGTFIVSPNTDVSIIRETKTLGLVSVPGSMTPTEVTAAYSAGADFVKLFPCSCLGPAYVKAIRAPLNHIPLVATGGIDAGNLEQYLTLGMAGAGIGGKLCDKNLIENAKFDVIEANARACADIAARF